MIVLDRLLLAPGLVLLVVEDGTGTPRPVPWAVDTDRRASTGEGAAEALVGLLAGGSRRLGSFTLTAWHHDNAIGERAFGVDQTNESVVVGEQAVVKWLRTAADGPHPAPVLLDLLQRRNFDGIPQPWGLLEWHAPGEERPRLLATVDTLVPGAVDGWTWAVDDLRTAVVGGSTSVVQESGRRLGDVVGRMHVALDDEDENAGGAATLDLTAWEAGADRDLDQALAVTTGAAHRLLAVRADAVRAATRVAVELVGSPLLRVHGDLHVGQVLRSETTAPPTYVVTDFDGNPVVPHAERLRPQPPALDVAGLTQSIQHAGLVLRRHEPVHRIADVTAAAKAFADAFQTTYAITVTELGHASFVQPALVQSLRLRQVCREFTYAATHLPRWSYVPEAALAALVPDPAPVPVEAP